MANTPQISVGMPVFNGERFLAETLRSILAQEFEDFELVVSDTASTDATREICEEFAARDRRIRYYRLEDNTGAAANFNGVFALSRAPVFKWAAHVDLLAPAHLRRCFELMAAAPAEVVLVYAGTMCIDEAGAALREYADDLDMRFPRPCQRLRHLLRHLHEPNVLFGLIRSSALRKTRLLGSYFSADRALLAELCMLGQFWKVPEPLFHRRMHSEMCCRANPLPQQQAVWFGRDNAGRRLMPHCRAFAEHLRAVRHVPLSPGQRARCYVPVLEDLVRRSGKRMAREIAGAAIGRFVRAG